MTQLPKSEHPLLVRTDFSDDAAWKALREAAEKPSSKLLGLIKFRAHVEILDDRAFDGLDVKELLALLPQKHNQAVLFAVDSKSITHKDRPILVVELQKTPARTFRVIPSELWNVENNLSLCNMGFEEFVSALGRDGIFRGFTF